MSPDNVCNLLRPSKWPISSRPDAGGDVARRQVVKQEMATLAPQLERSLTLMTGSSAPHRRPLLAPRGASVAAVPDQSPQAQGSRQRRVLLSCGERAHAHTCTDLLATSGVCGTRADAPPSSRRADGGEAAWLRSRARRSAPPTSRLCFFALVFSPRPLAPSAAALGAFVRYKYPPVRSPGDSPICCGISPPSTEATNY